VQQEGKKRRIKCQKINGPTGIFYYLATGLWKCCSSIRHGSKAAITSCGKLAEATRIVRRKLRKASCPRKKKNNNNNIKRWKEGITKNA
jgi:hypothetical protein